MTAKTGISPLAIHEIERAGCGVERFGYGFAKSSHAAAGATKGMLGLTPEPTGSGIKDGEEAEFGVILPMVLKSGTKEHIQ
jgi:hypothetical protein